MSLIHVFLFRSQCIGRINKPQILEPACDTSNTLKSDDFGRGLVSLDKASMDIWSLPQVRIQGCRVLLSLNYLLPFYPLPKKIPSFERKTWRKWFLSWKNGRIWNLLIFIIYIFMQDDHYIYSYVWANRRDVREALHIDEVCSS